MRFASMLLVLLALPYSLPAPDLLPPPSEVPEPGTLLLVGVGLLTAVVYSKNRKSRR